MRWTDGARGARPEGTDRRAGGRHRRWAAAAATIALAAAAGCTRPPGTGGGGSRVAALTRFAGCEELARYLQGAALTRVGPYGLSGAGGYWRGIDGPLPPMGAPGAGAPDDVAGGAGGGGTAAPAHSGTNVQEAGVDEPDVVKNDGRRLLAVAGGRLHVVDLTASPARLAGSLDLPAAGNAQLLLQGDQVLVISSEWTYGGGPAVDLPAGGAPPPDAVVGRPVVGMPIYRPAVARTRLSLVDIAEPSRPVVRDSAIVDGRFVDARLVGGRARVVTSAGLQPLPFVAPADGSEAALRSAQRENENVIRRTRATDWLPKARAGDGGGDGGGDTPLVGCDRVAHPPEFSGFDMVSVLSLDLSRSGLDLADTVGVAAGAQTVYASSRNLYVATQVTADTTYAGRLPAPGGGPIIAPPPDAVPLYQSRTALHAFDVSAPGPAAYRASGTVEGALLDQWSLSEHEGHLRVVTTTGNGGCGGCVGDQSRLSVLAVPTGRGTGGRPADLPVVGWVGGMGKGEAVKAVRFLGDRAYVVTFRQIDPFYVVDLSNPARPVVAGELKVPGYSAYLHPVGEGRVLGVGRDATPEGRVLGTKVALYDVTDATRPTEVRSLALPGGWTSVEQTAKAFLWWEPSRLAVIPVVSYGDAIDDREGAAPPAFTGVVGIEVAPGGLAERGRVANEPGPYGPVEVMRSAVAGDRLLTVSVTGVRVSDLASLATRAWVPFPAA